jgi:hypothetical protein
MVRARNYIAELSSSRRIHKIDGALRIIYGLMAGMIISLGIKSNIILGFVNSIDNHIFKLSFFGAIAGASEILLPNIIKQIEDQV